MAWAPDYITGDDLADFVRIDDDLDDAQLALAAATANRSVDYHCRRQFGKVDAPEDREYFVEWDRRRGAWAANIDDLMDATGLTIGGVAAVAPVLLPANAAQEGRPWERLIIPDTAVDTSTCGLPRVTVGAPWGWEAVPDPVEQAALLQGSRLTSRRGAPFGVAGSPDAGSEVRLLARLDPDVVVALAGYRRRARAR